MYKLVCATLLFFIFCNRALAQQEPDSLLSIVETEMQRELAEFKKADQPPYFLAYRISDVSSARIASSFGSLVASYASRSRLMSVDVKVGDYALDNTHPLENPDYGDFQDGMYEQSSFAQLPLDNHADAIRFSLWQNTQDAYRSSLAAYRSVKSAANQRTAKTNIPDFSKENAMVHIDPQLPAFATFFDKQAWEKKVKKYSESFLANEHIVQADASLEVSMERKYYLSSEGARVAQNRTYAYLIIQGSIRATDGDVVPLNLSYYAADPKLLPGEELIIKDVQTLVTKLAALRTAPVAEPYTGPAILHARAAGVFFHEIFGHRVEGHRLKSNIDGQTFKEKINEQVLPKTMSVVFDPTLTDFNGQALNGFYRFDDEGVAAQKVRVVEKGVLKTFLMSRTPIDNLSNSNGHGRAQPGEPVVSRQSNLILENDKPVSMADLRKMLIDECKKQKKPYGYLFADVVGGFTTTDRFMPNAFNIFPTEVYRVYANGREDELVRGVDLIGTPLAMFAEIKATDDKAEVFTGFCGAESGDVPVTAIAPSLFVKRIETQKKPTGNVEAPLIGRPSVSNK